MLVCFPVNNENIQLPDLHTLYSVFLVLCLTVHHPSIYVSNIFPYTLIYFLAPWNLIVFPKHHTNYWYIYRHQWKYQRLYYCLQKEVTLQQKYHLCNNKYSKTESCAMFELRNGGYWSKQDEILLIGIIKANHLVQTVG